MNPSKQEIAKAQEEIIRDNVLDYTRRAYKKSLETGKLYGRYFPAGSYTVLGREVDIMSHKDGYAVDYSCGNRLWSFVFTNKEVEA